ncbi:hypothetical protein ABKN59_003109 [Abortiporus biennis]
MYKLAASVRSSSMIVLPSSSILSTYFVAAPWWYLCVYAGRFKRNVKAPKSSEDHLVTSPLPGGFYLRLIRGFSV